MSRFKAKKLENVIPYQWGLQTNAENIIKLNTNECPYPPAISKLSYNELATIMFNKYPDPSNSELCSIIGEKYQVNVDNIFIGNGSDDVLAHCFQAFFDVGDKLKCIEKSYGLYFSLANLYQITIDEIKLNSNLSFNIEELLTNDSHILLANPNVPSGIYLERKYLIKVIESNPDYLVIIDEAYIDFAGKSISDLVIKYDNLIVIQTLSKSRSLAGLRIGLAIANSKLIDAMYLVRDCLNPYNMNVFAIEAAKYAFENDEYFNEVILKVVSVREWFKNKLLELGFYVSDSKTNFVLISSKNLNMKVLYNNLLNRNILVRYFDLNDKGEYLRISIGLLEEMRIVVASLEKEMKNSGEK